ncbi:hypothetical protein V8C37DRAFT_373878 [Trichoderma ceciliae]
MAAAVVEPDVGGSGTKAEESSDSKAKTGDASALPPPSSLPSSPPHSSSQAERGAEADGVPPPATGESSSPLPPPSYYPAPLRVSRKQVPAAAPAFKPYLPPAENDAAAAAAVAPLKVKGQRTSQGSQGDPAALPFRPYRPAGHVAPPESKADGRADAAAAASAMPPRSSSPSLSPSLSQSPSQPHGPLVTGTVAPQWTSPQPTSSADGVAPSDFYQPPAASSQPLLRPTLADPPASGLLPTAAVAVAEPASIAAPTPYPYHGSQHAVPQTPSGPSYHPSPSPPAPRPVPGNPSASNPTLGYPSDLSPVPGHQPYGPPHSAPTSSIPSPEMASYQFQPVNPAQSPNLYPVPTSTPPTASPGPQASMSYPPPQHLTPPPPTSGYDIPQPTYATYASSSAENPPSQPPRPQFQQAAMGAHQPQPSPQSPPPYMYANVPRPVTQPPPSTQPSSYNLLYGLAIAPHQHQYPTQPTYAAPNSNVASFSDPQDPYASPPLPPRPATTQGSQPQLFTGFTPHVVAYPPPPKRAFDPPPAAPLPPPRKPSGGTSGGRLFSSSSALKWIDKRGKGLENRLDAVLGSQGPSNRPPPQPPRPS